MILFHHKSSMETNLENIIFELQKEWVKLQKSAENPFFKSNYIPLSAILEYLLPKLSESNVLCYHKVENTELVTIVKLIGKEESIESRFPLNSKDPQKQGSEISYGKRYNLWCIFNIQETQDDDWNLASSGGNTKKFYVKPYTKKQFLELAEAFNTWGRDTAYATWQDQKEDFEINKMIEEKVKKLWEVFKANQQIDEVDSIWKDAEATKKQATG